jgi:hypothetical protein
MKNSILGAIVAILILLGLSIVVLYNTQEFDTDFNFKDSLTLADLELQKSFREDVSYLASARAELGTLELDNQGIFTQLYKFPNLVGCLDIKEGADVSLTTINDYQFQITFVQNSASLYSGNTVDVPTDEKQNYKITGEYNSYNVPTHVFEDSIKGISIFNSDTPNQNPLREDYRYKPGFYGDNCNYLRTQSELIATIPIN